VNAAGTQEARFSRESTDLPKQMVKRLAEEMAGQPANLSKNHHRQLDGVANCIGQTALFLFNLSPLNQTLSVAQKRRWYLVLGSSFKM
jgi:hypothetical protein